VISKTTLLALIVAGWLAPGDENDRVLLDGGQELRGRVLFEDRTLLVLRQGAREVEIDRQRIERVESQVRDLDAVLDGAERADARSPEALDFLADLAHECKLLGEEQLFRWRQLELDPNYEPARLALGHTREGSSWSVPLGTGRVSWEQRKRLAAEWNTAWEFSSLHYQLRSNRPLAENLALMTDLERLYQGFYELFGQELRLYEVCHPLRVYVHADAASFPLVASEFGYYDREADTIHLNAVEGLVWPTLAHEVTHQLLCATARERGSAAPLPAWLDEGLAEYVAAGVGGAAGHRDFEPGRKNRGRFLEHDRSRNRLSLSKVLSLSTDDYRSTSDGALMYSQSYTLVDFLLHGGEGRYRPGFLDYLRGTYRGKTSSSDLRRCLKAQWRRLEPEWKDYVHEQAAG